MATGDHSSYLTSTTSQVVLITVVCYAISALTLVVIGAWKGNAQFIQVAQTSMESLFTVVFPLYADRTAQRPAELVEGEARGDVVITALILTPFPLPRRNLPVIFERLILSGEIEGQWFLP